jgi:hypothetical protein
MGSRPDHSTGRWAGLRHAVSRAIPLRPAIIRGQLYHVIANVAFIEFKQAACAWSAADAEFDALVFQRTATLADMRRQGGES